MMQLMRAFFLSLYQSIINQFSSRFHLFMDSRSDFKKRKMNSCYRVFVTEGGMPVGMSVRILVEETLSLNTYKLSALIDSIDIGEQTSTLG